MKQVVRNVTEGLGFSLNCNVFAHFRCVKVRTVWRTLMALDALFSCAAFATGIIYVVDHVIKREKQVQTERAWYNKTPRIQGAYLSEDFVAFVHLWITMCAMCFAASLVALIAFTCTNKIGLAMPHLITKLFLTMMCAAVLVMTAVGLCGDVDNSGLLPAQTPGVGTIPSIVFLAKFAALTCYGVFSFIVLYMGLQRMRVEEERKLTEERIDFFLGPARNYLESLPYFLL